VLTGAGLPIPEEVFVIFAGIASKKGVMDPWFAFASCLVGALLGDLITYSIGRHFGRNIVREHHWFTRYITPEREQKMEALIHRRGPLVFFFARFMVGLRSPVYLAAGVMNVPFRRFILIDALCATSVIGVFFGLSYTFADQMSAWWERIRQGEMAFTVIVVVAVLAVAIIWYRRHRRLLVAEALAAMKADAQTARSTSLRDEHAGDTAKNGAATNGAPGKQPALPKAGKHG
jgi:membrane protein DedA with SNARE-associated domain